MKSYKRKKRDDEKKKMYLNYILYENKMILQLYINVLCFKQVNKHTQAMSKIDIK